MCNDGVVGAQIRQNLRDLIDVERRDALEDMEDNFLFDEVEDNEAEGEHPGETGVFYLASNYYSHFIKSHYYQY